ncbi:MAG: nuclease A inhibitor family protein [Deltaproteobacteria bacterium]|nr:nuclease A inhibitor family protein [Deltaproteobacteria bacterium]
MTNFARLGLALAAVTMGLSMGCGAPEIDGADEASVEEARATGEQHYAVRRDTRRCVAPLCGGFWLARVGSSLTLCADGRRLPECYVPELSVSGISAAQLDHVRGSAHFSARRVFVRGRLEASRVNATQAWVAPATAASLTSTLRLAYRPTCAPNQRCAGAVSEALSNGRTAILASIDLARATGSAAELAEATRAAQTSTGIITQGTLSATTGGNVLRVNDFAAPIVGAAPGLCAVELQRSLATLTEGLFFPSESDYPFDFIERPSTGTGPITVDAFRAAFALPATQSVEVRSLAQVFAWIATERPDMSDEERALAQRYAAVRDALSANLQDVQVFRFGTIQVQVYIVGRTRCGAISGLKTVSVET